jgi:hypothetical protein
VAAELEQIIGPPHKTFITVRMVMEEDLPVLVEQVAILSTAIFILLVAAEVLEFMVLLVIHTMEKLQVMVEV